jgi:hypothetical protein
VQLLHEVIESQEALAVKFEGLLARVGGDDAASAATPAQYEVRGRQFLLAQFERRFGLRVVGNSFARSSGEIREAGSPSAERTFQWDFRAPVNVNRSGVSHGGAAGDFVIYPARETYGLPPTPPRARVLTPNKAVGAGNTLVDVASDYMAVFEITAGDFARSRRSPGLLQRLEERLRVSFDRARAIDDSSESVLDVVAVIGIVSPISCYQYVGEKCTAAAFPHLSQMMAASRFVWLKLDAADAGSVSGGGGGGPGGGGFSPFAPLRESGLDPLALKLAGYTLPQLSAAGFGVAECEQLAHWL